MAAAASRVIRGRASIMTSPLRIGGLGHDFVFGVAGEIIPDHRAASSDGQRKHKGGVSKVQRGERADVRAAGFQREQRFV
jgi:hypothetical protein